jgi:hypothetical protein
MKLELFGIVIEISNSKSKYLRERRRRAALVLKKCNYSTNAIERIKAIRSLGPGIFPELTYHSDEYGTDMVGLKAAKEWIEEAFLDNGIGGIA